MERRRQTHSSSLTDCLLVNNPQPVLDAIHGLEPTNAAYVRSLLDRHDEAVLLEMEAEAAESGFPIVGRTVELMSAPARG